MINKIQNVSISLLLGLGLVACETTNLPEGDVSMPELQQKTYLSQARNPRQFGFDIYGGEDGGLRYKGATRLHPNHVAQKKMEEGNVPLIKVRGRSKRKEMNLLIDFSSASSWMEFSTSQDFNVFFMGNDGKYFPYYGQYNTGGEDAYAGIVTQIRIDNLFMENTPFYVRMATGTLGPLARGIYEPQVNAVLGYDNLKDFEYVQFDFISGVIRFSTTHPYTPHAEALLATALITKGSKHGLTVKGYVDGIPQAIVLDMVGNYSFARGDIKVKTTMELDINRLAFDNVPTLVLPTHNAPARMGRKLLSKYIVTVCPKKGIVYFEQDMLY